MKEQSVEEYLVERVEAAGGFAPKTVWVNRRGCPDREVYWPWGDIDKVELKRPVGGRYEPGQEQAHKQLAKFGVPVYMLHHREAVDAYVAARLHRYHATELFSVPLLTQTDVIAAARRMPLSEFKDYVEGKPRNPRFGGT